MERDVGLAPPLDFMPNGNFDPNSTGESVISGSPSPLRSNEKVQSRYLSPPMASCHDFCKYGKKNETDAVERRLNLRKFLNKKKKELPRDEKQNEVTIVIAGEKSTKMGTKPKTTSKMQSENSDHTEVLTSRSPTAIRNTIALGEKKSPKISSGNKQGIKPETNVEMGLLNETEVPQPMTPSPMKNGIASVEKAMLQTSIENEHGQAKILNSGDEKKIKAKKVNVIRGGTPLSPLRSNLALASDINTSKKPHIMEKKTKSPVKKPISPAAPEAIPQKVPPSASEVQKLKPKFSQPHKRVDGAGKPAIALKTKTLLIRSLSQRKSSKGLIGRIDQENKIRSPGTSVNGESAPLNPSTISLSSKSPRNSIAQRHQDNKKSTLAASEVDERKMLKPARPSSSSKITLDSVPSVHLRKLRSIKRTSTSHDTVPSLQLRKFRSVEQNPKPIDTVPSSQLRKLRSVKQKPKPRDTVSRFQLPTLRSITQRPIPHDSKSGLPPRKLRSVKLTSAPHENFWSSQPRKLWNAKQTSALRDMVSKLQPRKLRSIKRNSSVKDEDKVGKPNTESKSANNDLDSNPEEEVSECATHISDEGQSDEEIGGNNTAEVSKDEERKRFGRATTALTRPEENTSLPFKLKFRRGKVVNLRSDSGARRLWFGIGLLASASPNGNATNPNGGGLLRRRGSRRKSLDSRDPDSAVHSVVLKHQGVAEKKEEKSLFNHVIEETASKLVETKKSKVQALVGAFETVISLQEKKPISTV